MGNLQSVVLTSEEKRGSILAERHWGRVRGQAHWQLGESLSPSIYPIFSNDAQVHQHTPQEEIYLSVIHAGALVFGLKTEISRKAVDSFGVVFFRRLSV